MRGDRIGTEPGRHIGTGQSGELPDIADPHAPQQIRKVLTAWCGEARLGGKLPDGQRRQEHRVFAGLDDPPCARGEHRGGQPVCDTHLAFGTCRRNGVDQPLCGRLLGAEVARSAAHRQYQQAWPQHLGARHQIVDRCRHVLEVTGIARRVGGDHM